MTLNDLLTLISDKGLGTFLILALTVLIQISPLKLDPLSWLGDQFNKHAAEKINKLSGRVDEVDTKVDATAAKVDETAAIQARARILRFEGELRRHIDHTKGDFDATLKDCKSYEQYTAAHPDFENGMTEPAISHIRSNYTDRLERNDFLV